MGTSNAADELSEANFSSALASELRSLAIFSEQLCRWPSALATAASASPRAFRALVSPLRRLAIVKTVGTNSRRYDFFTSICSWR